MSINSSFSLITKKHQSSVLLTSCEGNPLVTDGIPHKVPVMWRVFLSHDVSSDSMNGVIIIACATLSYSHWTHLAQMRWQRCSVVQGRCSTLWNILFQETSPPFYLNLKTTYVRDKSASVTVTFASKSWRIPMICYRYDKPYLIQYARKFTISPILERSSL